jgi:hypothetical protein
LNIERPTLNFELVKLQLVVTEDRKEKEGIRNFRTSDESRESSAKDFDWLPCIAQQFCGARTVCKAPAAARGYTVTTWRCAHALRLVAATQPRSGAK